MIYSNRWQRAHVSNYWDRNISGTNPPRTKCDFSAVCESITQRSVGGLGNPLNVWIYKDRTTTTYPWIAQCTLCVALQYYPSAQRIISLHYLLCSQDSTLYCDCCKNSTHLLILGLGEAMLFDTGSAISRTHAQLADQPPGAAPGFEANLTLWLNCGITTSVSVWINPSWKLQNLIHLVR